MMNDSSSSDTPSMRTRAATQLLRRIHDGDSSAADDLLPLVYEQLRRLAQRFIRNERDRHTLQPTALVHEAYLKLVHGGGDWADREHFCAVAATAMRQILSNHARGKRAAKRDGVRADVSIDQLATPSGDHSIDLIALDEALTKLSELDERLARIVELRFFSGLTMDEIADHLKMSRRTAQRDWRWVRAWLSNELSEELES